MQMVAVPLLALPIPFLIPHPAENSRICSGHQKLTKLNQSKLMKFIESSEYSNTIAPRQWAMIISNLCPILLLVQNHFESVISWFGHGSASKWKVSPVQHYSNQAKMLRFGSGLKTILDLYLEWQVISALHCGSTLLCSCCQWPVVVVETFGCFGPAPPPFFLPESLLYTSLL